MMIAEDDKFVVTGPEATVPIPKGLLGNFIYNSLINNHVEHEYMVDAFTKQSRTYRSLLENSCTLAQALRNYGVNSSSVISVSSENSLKYFDGCLASLYLGAILAPINHMYTTNELNYILNLYQPKIIFCSQATVEKFVVLKKNLKCMGKIILIEGEECFGIETIEIFIKKNLKVKVVPEIFRPFNGADPEDHVTLLLSSSGTTGLPKGVMLTDKNLLARIAHSRESLSSIQPIEGFSSLGLMPFFHAFGFTILLNGVVNQERIIAMKQFDEDIFLSALQDYKISLLIGAPPLAVFLAKSPKVLRYDLSSVKDILFGAAPLSKNTEFLLKQRLKATWIRQGYGLTEATFGVVFLPRKLLNKPGSSGTVVSNTKIKIRDPETGKSLGPNRSGEICIKSPLVMKGYYKNPQSTAESFTSDGWLRTGDLGYYDDDGYFFIIDRVKELIKYKGYQVAPAELEALLLRHPKVFDVGVVGAPDELAGELPVGFVVKKPGVDLTEKELMDYIAENVSPQKRLRGGIFFVETIPKSPTGKILRRVLKTMLKSYQIKRESKL